MRKKFFCLAFLWTIVLVILSTGNASKRYKRKYNSNSSKIRVKREWEYGKLTCYETAPGGAFERTKISFELRATESNVKTYEISGPGFDQGIFSLETALDQMSKPVAFVWQEKPVDRETQNEYKLDLIAKDYSGMQIGKSTVLKIEVFDINDNHPVFLTSSLQAQVQEDFLKNTNFHQIKATDADDATDGNNQITYSKVVGSEKPPGEVFSVLPDGSLQVIGELDAEQQSKITFEVEAEDKNGMNGNMARSLVTVEILDANDNAPQFVGTPYKVEVEETAPLGSSIFEFEASDEDIGINSQVSFRIVSGNELGHFGVKSFPSFGSNSVGQIIVEKELDFETPPNLYELNILAYNANATNIDDKRYQTTTKLNIIITDVNEPPKFLNTPYNARVSEGFDTKVQNLAVNVVAVDYDFGGQTVTYSLEPWEQWFEINPVDGSIKTIDFIDREHPNVEQETSIYKLTVRATDPTGKFEIAYVNVLVEDINDNPPRPYGNGWQTSVCRNMTATGHYITTISASDNDTAANGPPIKFSLLPGSKFFLETNDESSVKVMTNINYFDVSSITEDVIIKDSPSSGQLAMTSTAKLVIDVCDCLEDGSPNCHEVSAYAGASTGMIIGILIAICLLMLVALLVAYNIKKKQSLTKEPYEVLDEDDVRNNLEAEAYEGGGEEDNEDFDLGALQPLALEPGVPYRMDEKPQFASPASRMMPTMAPDENMEKYIGDALQQANADPRAPPFDSLLVFDYEGVNSDAGTLSSVNSGTTVESQDYNYLESWGPRFNKIADAYRTGPE